VSGSPNESGPNLFLLRRQPATFIVAYGKLILLPAFYLLKQGLDID